METITQGSREWAESELTGRCRDRRKMANNTYLERLGDDIGLRLHDTHVIVWKPNGDIVLDSGGWRSMTTKERMTNFLPGTYPQHSWVRQEKGIWFVKWHDDEHRYADGMVLHPDGTVSGALDDEQAGKRDRINKTKRKHIKQFVDSITPEDIVYRWENPGGDCLLCRAGDTDHLLEHIEDRYFFATLAYNAIKAKRYRSPDVIMSRIYGSAQRGQVDRLLTESLNTYLKKHILEGVATR